MSRKKKRQPPRGVDLPMQELERILERTRVGAITEDEYTKLKAMLELVAFLKAELQAKSTSIERLQHLLFGPSTEKTRQIVADPIQSEPVAPEAAPRTHPPRTWPQRRAGIHRRTQGDRTTCRPE